MSRKPHRAALRTLSGAVQLFWSFFAPPEPASKAPRRPRKRAAAASPAADETLTRQAAELLRGVGCEELAARVAVCWHGRLSSTAGLARSATGTVLLNPRLREFPGEVEQTLRHELAHLVAFDRARGRRITAHGPEWRRACADLGIAGESRCHTLPLPRRQVARGHVYQCPRCAFVLRRVRPINVRRRRLACSDCCRAHAGGRFDRRFEFVKVRG